MLTAADRHHNIKSLLFLSPPQVIVRRSKWVFYLGMTGKKVKVALSQCAPTGYFQPWPDIQVTTIATIAVLRHNSPVHCDVSSCTICAYLPQITGLLWLQVSSRLWLSCSGSNNGNYEKYSWHWLYSFLMRYDHDVMAHRILPCPLNKTDCLYSTQSKQLQQMSYSCADTNYNRSALMFILAKIGHPNNSF